jgi:hypothetical protein
MNGFRLLTLAAAIAFAMFVAGCGDRAETTENETVTVTETTETTTGVALEPAYPEDVSSEALTEEDKAQQQTHRHGDGEEHSHDSGTKSDDGHRH